MPLNWIRTDDYEAMCLAGATRIADVVESRLARRRPVLLGLATGNTMVTLYERLAAILNRRGPDLSELYTFNLDEYMGADGHWIPPDHPLSYHAYMDEHFFRRLAPKLRMNRKHICFPDPATPGAMDDLIRDLGGLDLQLLGIGFNGHIAFNEPMAETEISVEAYASLPTRVVDLAELTIDTNARLTAGGDRSKVPCQAVSMGMSTILAAREILLLASFAEQCDPLRRIRQGRATPTLPASYLVAHPNATIIYTGDNICLEGED